MRNVMIPFGFGMLFLASCSSQVQFPDFRHQSIVLDYETLKYNPCDDVLFPSIIKTDGYISNPLGKYYMYYAPHNAPGGICLAYADSLEGPWIEYGENPLILREWNPFYKVSHICSPHIIWIEEESQFLLYFHGENDTTRIASTTDGIHFKYEGIAVNTKMFNNINEASYARIFRHTIPSRQNRYILMFMGNNRGTRRIYIAFSRDGRTWEAKPDPFINPPPGTGVTQICAPWYFPYEGKHYIVFHGDKPPCLTNLYVVEVGENFDMENHIGELYDRFQISGDNERISDPFIVKEGKTWYLFGAIGKRLNERIALAIANEGDTKPIALDNADPE